MKTAPMTPNAEDLLDVLGAVVFALAKGMGDIQRTQFIQRLDGMAALAQKNGKAGVTSGLQQVSAAVRMTSP